MENYTFIDEIENFEDGEMDEFEVQNHRVLVSRVGDDFFAVGAICTHESIELVDGDLEDHFVTCPLHFACFDIRTGAVESAPATEPLPVFEVKIYEGKVWVSNKPQGVHV